MDKPPVSKPGVVASGEKVGTCLGRAMSRLACLSLSQDAMTYVRHFGRPDHLVTLTCNPKWREITNIFKHGQKS
jgi:hypothetical protein